MPLQFDISLGDIHNIDKMFHQSWLFQQQQKLHMVRYKNIDKCPQNGNCFAILTLEKKKLCVQQRLCTFSAQI